MNLDGITLHCVTDELSQILAGGTISRVYQPEARTLYFRIFNDKGTHHLIITLDDTPRLYVAESMPPTPDVPTGLAMFLRKYYENGRTASSTSTSTSSTCRASSLHARCTLSSWANTAMSSSPRTTPLSKPSSRRKKIARLSVPSPPRSPTNSLPISCAWTPSPSL